MRAIRLAANIGSQWLASATYLPSLEGAAWDAAIRRLCGGTLRALDIAVVTRGSPPPAQAAVLLAANHVSWLDSYAIHSVRGCRFVTKEETGTWPIFRTIIKGGKSIPIVRGNPRGARLAKEAAAAALRSGQWVGVFAEATTTDGSYLRNFHPALFQAAVETGALVTPVAISYQAADGLPARAAAYWGDITFAQSAAAIIREAAIVARLEFCEPICASGRTRRELAELARSSIARSLGLPLADRVDQRALSKSPGAV